MRHVILICASAGLLVGGAACSTEPRMATRTYDLPRGETSWQAVGMVLQDEWHRHEVLSQAERSDATAVVRTTPRGHQKIREALAVR